MTNKTPNIKAPLLSQSQANKELVHNEAIITIDTLLNNGVIEKDLDTPPAEPSEGDMYIVGDTPTGGFVSKEGQIAYYYNGWRFIEPRQGITLWINSNQSLYTFNGTDWQESGMPSGATVGLNDFNIQSLEEGQLLKYDSATSKWINAIELAGLILQNLGKLGIGTTADDNNKLAVSSPYVLLNNAGDSIRAKLNKNSEVDTASFLFQDNWNGKAEFGLIGNDNFTLKVSPDGSNWNDAFVVDKSTGNVDFKGDVTKNGSVLAGGGNLKNYLINGNFDVWQRGNSFINPATNTYTADRWVQHGDGSGLSKTISKQNFAVGQSEFLNHPKHFLRWEESVARTGETYKLLEQKIEDVETLSNGNYTISFYAKANTPITPFMGGAQCFGSGGSDTVYLPGQSFNLTTNWQKFSFTFAVPSVAGKTVGIGSYLSISFNLPLNSAFTIDIAQVQVEEGDAANQFERRTIGEEIRLCQRYFEKSYNLYDPPGSVVEAPLWLNGAYADPHLAMTSITFHVEKRTAPTVTVYSFTGAVNRVGSYSHDLTVSGLGDVGTHGVGRVYTSDTSTPITNSWRACHYIADAEL